MSVEEYLRMEREAEFPSEFIDGQVVAMSRGTWNHGTIADNVGFSLKAQLRGRPCSVKLTGVGIWCARYKVSTYPDILVVCGEPKFFDKTHDLVTDATVIVEVLSPGTMNYDRGEKFRYYRSLASFREYLLIAQDGMRAEHHVRQENGAWLFTEISGPADTIELRSIGCSLVLSSLYEGVGLEEEAL